MMTRRKFIEFGIASCLTGNLTACVSLRDLQPDCPIDWAPSLLSPVFYGFRDYPDPAVRVFYPSLDGSANGAALLLKCERFPLVLLIHGDCGGNPFNQWISLPAQLARSGYVVAVTSYGGKLGNGDPAITAPLREVHDWMRNSWEHRERLMPVPNTAVVGHSFGATLGAQLVTEIPVTAFAGLSGTFGQLSNPASALSRIRVPSLFTWNNVDDVVLGAELFNANQSPETQMWFKVGIPKHGVIFEGGNHGDYMLPDSAPRCAQQGKCHLVRLLADDFVTTFLTKYLQPEFAFTAFTWVPDSLFVQPQNLPLPPRGGFYSGSYLQGFAASVQSPTRPSKYCVENVIWETAASTGSTFVTSSTS
jgi:dienelactone hydrolase